MGLKAPPLLPLGEPKPVESADPTLAWACVALFALALLSLGPVNASRHPVAPAAPASASKP